MDDYEDDYDYGYDEETVSVKLIDREGVQAIIDSMQDMDEDAQLAQNFLMVTCLLAQTQGVAYESFIQLVSQSWPMAGKIAKIH